MKSMLVLGTLAFALVATNASAHTTRYDALAESPMADDRPTPETAKLLREELLFQRATQIYLWALPLMNTLGMKVGSEEAFGAGYNILPVWKQRLNADTLVTTPNSDVIYAMSYLDLGKDGPMVLEAPPGLQGILLDFWQRPIPVDGGKFAGDVGLPGPDAGKGGKFLILPPGYKKPVPPGHFVYRSGTNNVFVFLRSFYKDPADLSPGVKVMEATKIHPLGAKSARPMQYPDASGVGAIKMLPLNDDQSFDHLKALLDSEGPWLADPDWLGMLASIGIVRGQAFDPPGETRAILNRAAQTGYKMSRVIGFEERVSGRDLRIWPDRRWLNPMTDATPESPAGPFDMAWRRKAGGYLDLDMRTWFFTNYYSTSPGMLSQVPGKGARYMVAFTDSRGTPLTGGTSYRLTLPANIPAANFWSVTVYEAENGSGLDNGQPFPSLGSRDLPAANADGSTDLFFGPEPPEGRKGNWIATIPDRGYFAIIRLYAPTQPALDKSWKPGDIEPIR